ncbi:MAG: hypothetical protein LBV22_00020 [Mycoplasmataceae bacterium]|jgi:hypothetical protein|nr:hypothetical protein [Mycoplasmataceae bacterium]
MAFPNYYSWYLIIFIAVIFWGFALIIVSSSQIKSTHRIINDYDYAISKAFPNCYDYMSYEIVLAKMCHKWKHHNKSMYQGIFIAFIPEIAYIINTIYELLHPEHGPDSLSISVSPLMWVILTAITHIICITIAVLFPILYPKLLKRDYKDFDPKIERNIKKIFKPQSQIRHINRIKEFNITHDNEVIPAFNKSMRLIKKYNTETDEQTRIMILYKILYSLYLAIDVVEQENDDYIVTFNGVAIPVNQLSKKIAKYILPQS